ncbi:MAG: PEGA domain-containing protein, partial [Acidobacteria bacterium]|nr:PEGA domain-containing protein [Acidobacteriota bacterium]
RRLFTQGSDLAEQERWAEALPLFRRSRALVARPSTIFNIASVLARLGRNIEAIETLDELDRRRRFPRSLRGPVAELRQRLEGLVAVLELRFSPINAEVIVDGEASTGTGLERRLRLDPGEHVVSIQLQGYEPEQIRISMLAGEREERQIVLRAVESRLAITTDRENGVIRIDGEIVGTGEVDTALRPGSHEILVSADGQEDYRRTIDLSPGERLEVRAALSGGNLASDPVFWVVLGVAALATALVVERRRGAEAGARFA